MSPIISHKTPLKQVVLAQDVHDIARSGRDTGTGTGTMRVDTFGHGRETH